MLLIDKTHLCTYNECQDECAHSVAYVWCDVVSKLLNGGQESFQLVELSVCAGRRVTRSVGGRRGSGGGWCRGRAVAR